MAAFTTVPHCARAVNTHLKTRSLTPEVYPPMQDERDGGGEQNQGTGNHSLYLSICSWPGTAHFAGRIV